MPENRSSIQSLQFENSLFAQLCYKWPYLHPWGEHGEWTDTRHILLGFSGLREVRVKVDSSTNGFDEYENANELMTHLMEGTKAKFFVEAM